jgi:hypothetical protein
MIDEAKINKIAARLFWLAFGLALLLYAVGCSTARADRPVAELFGVTVKQFKIVEPTKVMAEDIENGNTVELTLPRGCVVTVAAQKSADGPSILTMRRTQWDRRE